MLLSITLLIFDLMYEKDDSSSAWFNGTVVKTASNLVFGDFCLSPFRSDDLGGTAVWDCALRNTIYSIDKRSPIFYYSERSRSYILISSEFVVSV